MCRALADGLGDAPTGYTGSVTSTKLKVAGLDVFSAGDFSGGEGCEDIVLRDASRGVYKRLVVKDDRIVGAVLYGDTADGNWYFDLLKRSEDISEKRDLLIFGQAFASGGGALDPKAAVAALSDDAEICGCNGVSKGKVVACIEAGACSLDAVRSTCKASASCGSCTGLVETLLALKLGDDVQSGPKTMCKCTSFTHDDVRREIVAQGMSSIPEVMQKLHWTTPDGCSSCRPALNYYLLCALPGEYVDDQPSAAPRSTTISCVTGRASTPTTTSRASSMSACTPTSRRTAPIPSSRACGAGLPTRVSCGLSPTWWRSSTPQW
jgi:nitrite reductase (NADH) large subunit